MPIFLIYYLLFVEDADVTRDSGFDSALWPFFEFVRRIWTGDADRGVLWGGVKTVGDRFLMGTFLNPPGD